MDMDSSVAGRPLTTTEVYFTLTQSAMHRLRRDNVCRSLLLDTARNYPDAINENFVNEITLSDILALSRRQKRYRGAGTTSEGADSESAVELERTRIPQEDDILRFGLPPRYELGTRAQQRLMEELDKIIFFVTEFFHADVDWHNLHEEERSCLAWSLPEDIKNYKHSIGSTRSEVNTAYSRIENLMSQLDEAHSQLRANLTRVIATYSPEIHNRRGASNELLAARIEVSLIKLSLIRARATRALYDHRSLKNPNATIAQAISAAHAKLKAGARKMNEEETALNQQLAEYETILKLVDGDGRGFAQVIEDWTRVQKEREECMRDLQRLGWTGD